MKKTIWLILAVILLLVTVFFIGRCSTKTERSQQIANLKASRDSVKQSYITIDGLKNSVWEKSAIILSQNEAIKAGLLENARLKAIHMSDVVTNTQLAGEIKVLRDSLKLPPQTVFITVKDTTGVTHDYVKIPFQLLNVKEKYLSLNAGMRQNKTAWFDLSVPFTGSVSVGYVGSGFLHLKKNAKGMLTSDNPYLRINQMDVVIVQDKKTLFQKTWFNLALGGAIVEGLNIFLRK